ncbi:hypothetical protein PT285_08875 [Lactobacillus sp. ESL0791]|nr:hypothetical protein [Lactobacillus sp. ESL0791]MDF7639510.1 hypothetical protein [Lactobacillus sp. ESL0791]
MKSETEKMLDELTKDDPELKEYAEQYGRQLEASVLIRHCKGKNSNLF